MPQTDHSSKLSRPELPSDKAVIDHLRASAADIVLPYFQSLTDAEIKTKTSPNDFVTIADEQCEAYLSAALVTLLPGSTVVGEEAVAADPSILERLNVGGDVWIIDPIDGTYNYAHDDPRFATIVALVRDGVVVAGYIHVPVTGQTYAARLGGGVWRNGERLRVAEPAPLGEMTAVLYVGKSRAPALYERIKALKGELGPRRFDRSAAFEHIAMLTGKAHYSIFTRLLPWDHAAGILMCTEAGGCYGYFDEGPSVDAWSPVNRDMPFLLAPDPATWWIIRQKLGEAVTEPG